jgi:hypothetical protein
MEQLAYASSEPQRAILVQLIYLSAVRKPFVVGPIREVPEVRFQFRVLLGLEPM